MRIAGHWQSWTILDILRQRTRDVEVKKYCVSLLEKLGSFKYTRETLEALDKEARNEVELLGPNPIMNTLLDELLSWKTSTDWGWLEHSPIKKPRLIWRPSELWINRRRRREKSPGSLFLYNFILTTNEIDWIWICRWNDQRLRCFPPRNETQLLIDY